MPFLWSKPSDFMGWAVFALGLLLILLGMPLLIGGARLIALGGSWYYLPAGIALIASGVLLMLRRRLGALIYGVLFIVTVLWSLFEVGLNGWALVPRIFGLSILLLLVLAALPVLQPVQLVRTGRPMAVLTQRSVTRHWHRSIVTMSASWSARGSTVPAICRRNAGAPRQRRSRLATRYICVRRETS